MSESTKGGQIIAVLTLLFALPATIYYTVGVYKSDEKKTTPIINTSTTNNYNPVRQPEKPGYPGSSTVSPRKIEIGSSEPKKTESATRDSSVTAVETIDRYINSGIQSEIALVAFGNDSKEIDNIKSGIADFYKEQNHSVTTSLFTNGFINSKFLEDVRNGNTKTLNELGVLTNIKNIIICKYASKIVAGTLTRFICRASLTVTIISCIKKSQIDGFTLSVANGFEDEDHAERGAAEKIIAGFRQKNITL
ncbi:MAG: hypothetical protein V4450_01315 [Bacteroidota bacterium]